MILFNDTYGKPFKVSRKFTCERDEDGYVCCEGSANDILKVIRDIEGRGYKNQYLENRPVLRARRKYGVYFYPLDSLAYGNEKTYTLSRIDD